MTSTERSRQLKDKRLAEGWTRLHDWITPEAAKALDALCQSRNMKRGDLISDLLVSAVPSK